MLDQVHSRNLTVNIPEVNLNRILFIHHGPGSLPEIPLRGPEVDQRIYPTGDQDWSGLEQAAVFKQIYETRQGFQYSRVVCVRREPRPEVMKKLFFQPIQPNEVLCEWVKGPNPVYRNFQSVSADCFSCSSVVFNRMGDFNRSHSREMQEIQFYPVEYRFYGHIKSMGYRVLGLRYEPCE